MAKLDYDALNSMTRYMMISVFAVQPDSLGQDRTGIADDTATFLKQQEDKGVVVRGLYDVAGFRADSAPGLIAQDAGHALERLQTAVPGSEFFFTTGDKALCTGMIGGWLAQARGRPDAPP